MIASVRGSVLRIGLDSVDVDVTGLGYRVFTTADTLASIHYGDDVTLATSLVVREDSLTLYGFAQVDERDTFEILQTVSGVGPRLALAMLTVHSPDQLRAAIGAEDTAMLKRVPGVGEKSAKRLILELQGKLGAPDIDDGAGVAVAGTVPPHADVLHALEGLGWSLAAAEQAVGKVLAADDAPQDTPTILRAALQVLGGNRG